ncbi:anti sigma factor C-terminal domain-containing protein [Niallia nealsonii]|uniref:Sigma factor regulator n=1 Tax=Niallia nealsonii TaxID=115979 RepID=A0A2N0Z1C9_9BACI|nr:anti sigma factor C-terminal domain-containing protein [Niallia nealsonii]PKG23297.1 hypothetical protein CWS01_12670 [Niallia nealsonii]
MEKIKENELEDIFDEKSLKKTLKKAKRITLVRTLLISVIVCLAVGYGVHRTNIWIVDKRGSEVAIEHQKADAVMKAPNTFIQTETIDFGFFKGTVKRKVYKVIEDKIIPWDTEEAHFGIRGFTSTSFSSYSTIVNDTTVVNIPSGEKEMMFYVPRYTYQKYSDDLAKLKDYPEDKYMEMGISFDKSYSLEEVKKLLPKSVHPTWFWVNNYDNKPAERSEPEFGRWLYGIYQATSELGKSDSYPNIKNEAAFLNKLKEYNKYDYKELKKRQKDGLIIGVVVTGTKEDLLSLKGKSYVKASSIGAVVDKY